MLKQRKMYFVSNKYDKPCVAAFCKMNKTKSWYRVYWQRQNFFRQVCTEVVVLSQASSLPFHRLAKHTEKRQEKNYIGFNSPLNFYLNNSVFKFSILNRGIPTHRGGLKKLLAKYTWLFRIPDPWATRALGVPTLHTVSPPYLWFHIYGLNADWVVL